MIEFHTVTLPDGAKDIDVFEIEGEKAEKIGKVEAVTVYDRAGNKLIDDLYADIPIMRTFENLLDEGHIPPETELRLGMFFEVNYIEKSAKIHYFWYLKKEGGQIQLLTDSGMSEKMRIAEKARRLFFSGFDILRGRTLTGDKVEIEQNIATVFKTERICAECGRRFTPNRFHRNEQKFCSRTCYRRNYYKKKQR